MFTQEELQILLQITNSVQISGKDAITLVRLQSKIQGLLLDEKPKDTKDIGDDSSSSTDK